jgi:hypothetical protein
MVAERRAELIHLIERIIAGRFSDRSEEMQARRDLREAVPHPDPFALIFHDTFIPAMTAEQVLEAALSWVAPIRQAV